jgi:hypothetical protein
MTKLETLGIDLGMPRSPHQLENENGNMTSKTLSHELVTVEFCLRQHAPYSHTP